MGGRGSGSGMVSGRTTSYADYTNINDANNSLGFGNGGETDKWTGGLSAEEKRAINNYSRAGYKNINGKLRKLKDGEDIDPNSPVGKRVNAIEGAINRYELTQPTTFHRSGSIFDFMSEREVRKMMSNGDYNADIVQSKLDSMVGKVMHDKGFVSSSASRDKRSTAGSSFGAVEYTIRTPKGKGIGAYIVGASHYKDSESEFLFNRGSGFKITGISRGTRTGTTLLGDTYTDTVFHVSMEYVGRSK